MAEARYYYGTGRRKTSVARVRLYPGTGDIVVNGKPLDRILCREHDRKPMMLPLQVTEMTSKFSVMVKVFEGGVSLDRRAP